MELTAYTTFADIRAILGLAEEELPDETLNLETYVFSLESSLSEVGSTLEADYVTVSAANSAGTTTTLEKALYRAVRLYAAVFVSLSVAYSLPMRAQKSLTDGKAGFARFTDTPAQAMVDSLIGLVAAAKAELSKQYALSTGGSVQPLEAMPVFISISTPAVDPVTG